MLVEETVIGESRPRVQERETLIWRKKLQFVFFSFLYHFVAQLTTDAKTSNQKQNTHSEKLFLFNKFSVQKLIEIDLE